MTVLIEKKKRNKNLKNQSRNRHPDLTDRKWLEMYDPRQYRGVTGLGMPHSPVTSRASN